MADDARSPLRSRPLRNAGQSCDEQRRALFDDKLEFPVLAACLTTAVAVLEISRWYSNSPPQPIVAIAIAIIAIAFAVYRVRKYLPQMRNLALAAEGEKAVGQFLERLRSEGYEVLHDIPGDGFNVDHVLIGPPGVFSIETKTWRKPRRGKAELSFDGTMLLVDGKAPERDPIVQARAQSTWLTCELEAATGHRLPVRPVVLFPGWWIKSTDNAFREVWVLEPKALPKFLERERAQLDAEQVRMASYCLSRYVRTASVN